MPFLWACANFLNRRTKEQLPWWDLSHPLWRRWSATIEGFLYLNEGKWTQKKTAKNENKSHALTSLNERISQNSNIWSEWYTDMVIGIFRKIMKRANLAQCVGSYGKNAFEGGCLVEPGLPRPQVIELKLPLGYVGIWEIPWAPSGGCAMCISRSKKLFAAFCLGQRRHMTKVAAKEQVQKT